MKRNEKLDFYRKCMNEADSTEYDPDFLISDLGKKERRASSRKKFVEIREKMNNDQGTIFFLCSKHGHPAKDHEDHQGKLYVDRFWRSKLESSGAGEWLIEAVTKYIRKHGIVTVQEIIGPPVYLTTRPYCKHVLDPVHTLDVLTINVENQARIVSYHRAKRGAARRYVQKKLEKIKAGA